ncbi:SCP-like protein [Dictyocaulus viviparus]|uniref:SCP-like protein n=1 Tax=Dictyocaulus viviparus TaxID=29172 RepID=A0A0D8XGP1_DICVI|nr:SCP-like protein [Dictyocaulus viviparus]
MTPMVDHLHSMKTIATVIFFITILQNSICQGNDPGPHCNGESRMTPFNRRDFLQGHNFKRVLLAGGNFRVSFPPAGNMNYLTYNCDLEQAAHEIASACHLYDYYDFNYVGNNSAKFEGPYFDINFITDAVNQWWDLGKKYSNLENLTPSEDNSPMIPFLQMANGETAELGCSYNLCESTDDDSSSFFLLVCKYGKPYIETGKAIYTEGKACNSCGGKCVWSMLCDNTAV